MTLGGNCPGIYEPFELPLLQLVVLFPLTLVAFVLTLRMLPLLYRVNALVLLPLELAIDAALLIELRQFDTLDALEARPLPPLPFVGALERVEEGEIARLEDAVGGCDEDGGPARWTLDVDPYGVLCWCCEPRAE